jgi:hypothetical protein
MLTVWYAPAAKRAVKYSSRPTFGSLPPIDTYFDLELASYKLQQPGVAEALAEAAQRDESRRVQAALERQRVQLEALGLRLPEAVKPTPVAAPEPIVTASAAPTITAGSTASRLPKVGDTWTYRLSEPKRIDGPQQRSYTARVAAASPLGILEQYEIDLEKPGEWAHSPGAYVAGLGRSLFAPYLAALGELPASGGLGRIAIVDPACSGAYICEVSARVVGRETIKVPAGSFDAVKVVVDHSWRPMAGGGYAGVMFFGGRTLTVWYVPAVKRAVKYSSQRTFGELPPIDPDFDLELTSYQLK